MNQPTTILHIAYVNNDKTAGVSVVVPFYVKYQSKFVRVALFNLCKNSIKDITSFYYEEFKNIYMLPRPFSKPDLVVFHEIYRFQFIHLYRECKKNKIPYIIIPHGCLSILAQKKKKIKKNIGNLFFFNHFIRESKYIQYLSSEEEKNSKFRYKNSIVLHNGVELNSRVKHFTAENGLKLLFIGRYDVFFKGLDILMQAISLDRHYFEKNAIHLTMYGKGTNRDESKLRNMINDYQLNELVTLNGPVFLENKIEQYYKADYFIQTSRSEGQPMSLLEALSCGLPVIVTPGTTLANEVHNHNLGFSTELNAYDILETIKKANTSKDRLKEYSDNAFKFILDHYSWDTVTNVTVKKYIDIIKSD